MTRATVTRYVFDVERSHLLLHAGLSRRFLTRTNPERAQRGAAGGRVRQDVRRPGLPDGRVRGDLTCLDTAASIRRGPLRLSNAFVGACRGRVEGDRIKCRFGELQALLPARTLGWVRGRVKTGPRVRRG
jgi:hypothetical protein